MSLSQVLLPPPTARGLDEWSFAHYNHHVAIIGAVKATKKIDLQLLPIWPINPQNIQVWLENHQFMHNQANAVLKIQGNDLSTINWEDEKERQGFFYLNFVEHRSMAINSGQPI